MQLFQAKPASQANAHLSSNALHPEPLQQAKEKQRLQAGVAIKGERTVFSIDTVQALHVLHQNW